MARSSARARPTTTAASASSEQATRAPTASSSTRPRPSSGASSWRCCSGTVTPTSRSSCRRTHARATAAAERRAARRAVRGAHALRRAARDGRGSARPRAGDRARAERGGQEGRARRAPGDRRARDVGTLGGGAGNRRRSGRARGARRAEPRVRAEVRVSLRRLRQRTPAARDRAGPARAARANARGGARDGRRRARADRGGPVVALLALSDYWWGWGNLAFRWLHVIAAMAWIGASFYFIALDNHLEPPRDPDDARRGIGGEAWEVHGGGFYRVEKFRVAPERLPEPLHWFKWEAYTTWLSGFALFVVVYYAHANAFLVDRTVADLTAAEAIAISLAGLAIAWIVYDFLCP